MWSTLDWLRENKNIYFACNYTPDFLPVQVYTQMSSSHPDQTPEDIWSTDKTHTGNALHESRISSGGTLGFAPQYSPDTSQKSLLYWDCTNNTQHVKGKM